MKQNVEAQLLALDSLQDWSKWLVGVDAGVLGLLAFSVKELEAPCALTKGLLVTSFLSFFLSLFLASWLVGAIPPFKQALKSDHPDKRHIQWRDRPTLYRFRYGGFSLWSFALFQHVAFLVGAFALTVVLIIRVVN